MSEAVNTLKLIPSNEVKSKNFICDEVYQERYQPRITQIELNEALHYNYLFHLG